MKTRRSTLTRGALIACGWAALMGAAGAAARNGDDACNHVEEAREGGSPIACSFEALLTVAHPAVADGWSVDDVRERLGTPARLVEGAAIDDRSWLVYAFGDRQVLVALENRRVVAIQVEFRTNRPGAFDAAMHATSLRLGEPRERGRHEAVWLVAGLSVRLAGWRGEFNLSVGQGRS